MKPFLLKTNPEKVLEPSLEFNLGSPARLNQTQNWSR